MSQSGTKSLVGASPRVRDQIINAMEVSRAPVSPTLMARFLRLPLNTVAYHMRVLRDAGAIKLVDTRRGGGGEVHLYQLELDASEMLAKRMPQLLAACGCLVLRFPGAEEPEPAVLDDEARIVLGEVLGDLQPLVQAIVTASTARVVAVDARKRAQRAKDAADRLKSQLEEVGGSITAGQRAKRSARTTAEARSHNGAIRALTGKQKKLKGAVTRTDDVASRAEANLRMAELLRDQAESVLSDLLNRRGDLPTSGAA
jgi:DNA-binding transcriptional ArsR family regulator